MSVETVARDLSNKVAPHSLTFTVIIPSYNYDRFIARAIDSVLSQSFPDFELFVVDDGSTDSSWSIIEHYGDRVLPRRYSNQGAARACLSAFREARGQYIYVLDADDEMKAGCLETVARHLAQGPAKIQFPLTPIDADDRIVGAAFPQFPSPYSRAQMLQEVKRNGAYLTGPTSGIIYRADVLKAIGDVDYERYLDGVAYLLCPFMGDVVTIHEPLANYRLHGANASSFNAPTSEWIATERERFVARLVHLRQIFLRLGLDASGAPDGDATPYVLERRILERLANGESVPLALSVAYVNRLVKSFMPLKKKAAMSIWAFAVSVSPKPIRNTLFRWRYNPRSRPRFLQTVAAAANA
jgi:glycosyltransferase involved in cell wall biosynthesis